MELKHSLSTVLGILYLWSHAHLLTELVKRKTFLHLPGHLLLTPGDVFTTHGFLFMYATYNFLECSSHGLNLQEPFSHLSVDFSCSTWVQSSSGSCPYFWFSWAYHSSSKEEDSSRNNDGEVNIPGPRIPVHRRTRLILILPAFTMWFFPQLLVLSSYFTLLDVMGDLLS